MDTILRNACVDDRPNAPLVDIGIEQGCIAAIEPDLAADAETIDVGGRLVSPGFVETHIHLDKSCILDRVNPQGGLDAAIGEVARLKGEFTAEDVYQRARRTLEKCVLNGTTHMRTHLEVDPVIGLRSLDGIIPLVDEFKWAIDIEICIFPQEGLLNNPGTDELMVEALRRGGTVVGAAPYTDSDPHGQIDRVFEIARQFHIDVDMHLDFGADTTSLDLDYVCDLTDRHDYGGRVAIGHVTKLSALTPDQLRKKGRRLADAGVAVTVLPATDLFLMGRDQDHSPMRGVAPAHRLLHQGVNCSLATNNVLNPFTPFGDCSMVRMANLYANICHVEEAGDTAECFEMITNRPARLMRAPQYGIRVGQPADLVVVDAPGRAAAVAEVAPSIMGFKAGRRTFTRQPAQLPPPQEVA
ncbi:MAG: amidohydrolase family protein [Chloroflexi bacterium]|nr:amidohydrolase family protein [Chloroflexota bacterium]